MSRLAGVFADLKSNGRKGVIPYVVAGDPTPEGTVDLLHQLVLSFDPSFFSVFLDLP